MRLAEPPSLLRLLLRPSSPRIYSTTNRAPPKLAVDPTQLPSLCNDTLALVLSFASEERQDVLQGDTSQSPSLHLRRLVKVDLESAGSPETWEDLIPQHQTDLLQWASAHDVSVSCKPEVSETCLRAQRLSRGFLYKILDCDSSCRLRHCFPQLHSVS